MDIRFGKENPKKNINFYRKTILHSPRVKLTKTLTPFKVIKYKGVGELQPVRKKEKRC